MKKLLSILFFLITGATINAQTMYTETVLYTWMSGRTTFNDAGLYGTKGVSSATNCPPAIYSALSWTDNNGNFWTFGGSTGSSSKNNNLFKYDVTTNEWTWMKGSSSSNAVGVYGTKGVPTASTTPGARAGAISWKGIDGNLYLFGGYGYAQTTSQGDLNDLWKYDISLNEWTWIAGTNTVNPSGVYGTIGVPSATIIPEGREYGQGWVDGNGNFWMYGGYTSNGVKYHCDLWKFDVTLNQWAYMGGSVSKNLAAVNGTKGVPSSSNYPGSRVNGNAISDGNNLWLFGGTGNGGAANWGEFNQLWKYDITTGQWTWMSGSITVNAQGVYGTKGIANAANVPGAKRTALSWLKNNSIYVHGGWGLHSTSLTGHLNDLWKYNIATNEWTWISGSNGRNDASIHGTKGVTAVANKIGGRSEAISFIDNSGSLWLFGGRDFSSGVMNSTSDLWKMDFCNAPVAVNLTANSNTIICSQATASLTASGVGNLGWYNSATNGIYLGGGTNFTTPTLTATTTFYIQDSTCGPGMRTPVTVSVMPLPNVNILNLVACTGSTLNMVASGATSYTWNTGSNSTTVTITPTVNTTYTLMGTGTNGCIGTAVRTITATPLPTVSISGPSVSCAGKLVTLTGSGANTYLWNNSVTANPMNYAPTVTTTYTVEGTASTGCKNKAYITVTVNPIPSLTLTASSNPLCRGAASTLTVLGADTYTWSTSTNDNTITITPTVNTSYSVTGIYSATGCTNTSVRTITVIPTPTVSIIGGTISVCAGTQVILYANGGVGYLWNTSQFTSSISVSPTVTTTYSVIGYGAGNTCTNSAVRTITVNQLPDVQVTTTESLICTGQTATLSVSGANTYTWNNGSNNTDIIVSPSSTSNYTVTGKDLNNCSKAVVFTQSVSICTGLENLNNDISYLVYPNPTNGLVNVDVESEMNYVLVNVIGEQIDKGEFIAGKNHLDLSAVANGIYLLQLKQNQQVKTIRIVKQ